MSTRYWIPASGRLREVLERAGVGSVEELFSDIPPEARAREWDALPIGRGRPLTEAELREELERLLAGVEPLDPPPFAGGGVYPHYVPAAVDYVMLLGEILTSYTPYQPEASQGLLQALFEYQSMIAEIYEMDVANSSHYDGSTALAEAALMALRVRKGRRRILVPDTIEPRRRRVLEAYLEPHGARVEEYPTEPWTGRADLEAAKALLGGDVAAVVGELPSSIGVVDPGLRGLGEAARDAGALYIVYADPLASTLYQPPGRLGADIAVGEGQPLGLGLNYGGPYLGVMAVRWDMRLIRQMPGRIIGLTRDADGRRAFTMVLQTREQHIRRARATSNITTNEALMAVLAAAYMALHGGEGLRRLAETIRARTLYLARGLERLGLRVPRGELWREALLGAPCRFTELQSLLWRRRRVLIGPPAGEMRAPWIGEREGLVAVTESHSRRHVDLLLEALDEALSECRGG